MNHSAVLPTPLWHVVTQQIFGAWALRPYHVADIRRTLAHMGLSRTAMTPRECRDRLAAHSVGRVAITNRALPAVVPVAYAITGSLIYFRAQAGSVLARACNNTVVAFEIDELPQDQPGWSVLVIGMAQLPFGNQTPTPPTRDQPISSELGWDQQVTIEITQICGWQHASTDAPP